jgi:hypothetical protein
LSYRLETLYNGVKKPLHKIFWLVKVEENLRTHSNYIMITLNIQWYCNLYLFQKINLTTLMVKDLTCLCSFCINGFSKCAMDESMGTKFFATCKHKVNSQCNVWWLGWKCDYNVDGNAPLIIA